VKTVLENNPALQKAHEQYKVFTSSDKFRDAYEARLKWQRDQTSLINSSREEGMQQGLEQGMQQGARENARQTAKQMKKDGLTTELIVKYTCLSPEEIETL